MCVQLNQARVKIASERRHARYLIICHRNDYVLRFETQISCTHDKPITILPKAIDFDPVSDRQTEALRIIRKVIGHLVLGWERAAEDRKTQSRKGPESRRVKQAERIPTVPPGVSNPFAGVED